MNIQEHVAKVSTNTILNEVAVGICKNSQQTFENYTYLHLPN